MDDSKEIEELLNQGYRYALALTKDDDLAFDLVQNSYLKIVEAKAPMTIGYLIKTIKFGFIDQQRRKNVKLKWLRRRTTPEVSRPHNSVEPYLEDVLNKLPTKNREILFLWVVQEYTAKEIAELLEMSRGTILSILKRTKDKLKIQLTENKDVL